MPTFLVRFTAPVWYQPDHSIRRCEITELPVHAPTERGAIYHALRVTRGEAEILDVQPASVAPLPPVEAPHDTPITIDLLGQGVV